ncbi:MAG TPA: SDR family NAD(P)-dependent oxidoreductase [Opitutaceae bacterium]|jgi:NAD(P)-dependent dehydrogenase (short-subunit alcohol dehydrogenase family)|nr:SDR family NAD(P)-dependent oxidoreductase [Opitutaceae bacterium]
MVVALLPPAPLLPFMQVDLTSQVALVTGAAGGIGRATAQVLAANGARVVIADIDEDGARAAAALIPASVPLRMDVTSESEVGAAVERVRRECGRIDILVNNAGINTGRHRVTLEQFPTEEWDRIMAVDLRGLFLVSRAAAGLMLAQGGGRIINIASVLGVVPARLQCAFTAAKAGVVHLTRTMAIEFGAKNILTNCVAPGSVLTSGTEALFYGKDAIQADRAQRLLAHIPQGRPARVEEIAHAILFLAAPESSYINGQTLCVDGGWTAGGFLRDF